MIAFQIDLSQWLDLCVLLFNMLMKLLTILRLDGNVLASTSLIFVVSYLRFVDDIVLAKSD